MFDELITQGKSMIRRLEKEIQLSTEEINALPGYDRVTTKEADNWRIRVESRISELFGDDTISRYRLIWDERSDEVENSIGTERTRLIDAWGRIVRLMEELTSQPAENINSQVASLAFNAPNVVETYDFFISHASEDKEAIARPIYKSLMNRGLEVWFDEARLKLGDSLRRKIDDGLATSRYGIVILSPAFLAKNWPQRELDGLVARETANGEKAILPVWHMINKEELLRFSPTLADRLGVSSENGIDSIVDKIVEAIE